MNQKMDYCQPIRFWWSIIFLVVAVLISASLKSYLIDSTLLSSITASGKSSALWIHDRPFFKAATFTDFISCTYICLQFHVNAMKNFSCLSISKTQSELFFLNQSMVYWISYYFKE